MNELIKNLVFITLGTATFFLYILLFPVIVIFFGSTILQVSQLECLSSGYCNELPQTGQLKQ